MATDIERAQPRLFPSSPSHAATRLIGVVGEGRRVAPVVPAPPVDRDFLEAARPHGPLETRFRFASPCAENGCRQWTGSGCGVIERVLDALAAPQNAEAMAGSKAQGLPRCSIRGRCRWFAQRGPSACFGCRFVVTDKTGQGMPEN